MAAAGDGYAPGMPSVERTAHSPAPVGTVQAYLRDFANAEEWDAGTISCTPVDDTPVGVGKQWRNVSEFRGRETTLTYTLEADEPGHLRIVGRNKTVTSEDDMTLTADGPGTTVTYRATFTFHGAAKLATPLLVPALGKLADDAQRTLQQAIEGLPVT
ncbi:polyketide cyclase [Actinomycetospora sp. NBRC 106375]|uniref:SRPBCC family protein n=1 Tax=Actinomycetospora sp. NBRC 106375 TaxID=3032207 RepID=UPI0024A4AFE1|nr:SRPBCC family protein [Actinomycetospora sp. NBRC 106375]GLZ46590.1 polyketide cyclase [Actinomycetospora sp. NBRC 106375]